MLSKIFGGLFGKVSAEAKEPKPSKTGLQTPPFAMPTQPPKPFYDIAVDRVFKHEGLYSDHIKDKGGETMYGITKAVARAHGYHGDMKNLTLDFANSVYKKSYWDAVQADKFNNALAFQLFDACINHGPVNAIKLLQRAIGVTDDGILGPVTIHAANSISPSTACMLYLSERLRFYTDIKTWGDFGKGWARRVAENLKYAEADCAKY